MKKKTILFSHGSAKRPLWDKIEYGANNLVKTTKRIRLLIETRNECFCIYFNPLVTRDISSEFFDENSYISYSLLINYESKKNLRKIRENLEIFSMILTWSY